jgi:hypothetical protein
MDELSPSIFIVPTIALVLVVTLYIHFGKHVKNKHNYRHFIAIVSVLAFVLNFVWELVQGPLFKGFEYDWKHISFCGLASIVDMLMVLILLFGFGLVHNDVFWVKRLNMGRVLILILIGFIGAVHAEVWHTTSGDWSYAKGMPLVPIVDVGVSPVVQFIVLPLLIFLIGRKFINKENIEM